MGNKKSHKAFVGELKSIQPTIEILGEYSGARIPLTVRCTICGNIWDSLPTNLLKGRKCPKCSYAARGVQKRSSREEVFSAIEKDNPDIEIIGGYINTHTKVLAKCKKCSHEWMVLPSSLMRGSGCPRCAHTGTSFVEQTILLSLEKMTGYDVQSRNRSAIGLELDIFIPEISFAVEYGAWPWHVGKEEKDAAKFKLCDDKQIRLIEIFDAYTGSPCQEENIWLYKENISKAENIGIVKEIIIRLCDEIGIPYSLSDSDYEEIQFQARINSRRMSTADLNKKLSSKGIKIAVLNEYQDMLTKVHAKCLVCGNEWDVIPASILRGLGCPKCANFSRGDKHRKSGKQFLSELKEVNPNIEILGNYKGNHEKLEVKCLKHGVVWETTPGSLLRGAGCTQCRSEKISNAQTDTEEVFLSKLKSINPNVEILTAYKKSNIKVLARCVVCNSEWYVVPSSLLRGEGCPKCGRQKGAKARRKDNDQFVTELQNINPYIEPLEKYENSKTKVLVRCKKCSYEWSVVPTSLLRGSGCPNCAGSMKKTHAAFVSEMKTKNPDIIILGQYENANCKILVQCNNCGRKWEVTPTNLLSGKGCPSCHRKK